MRVATSGVNAHKNARVAAAAAGAYYFEIGEPGSQMQTTGDALWWAATLGTTMGSPLTVVTLESRIIGMLLRIYPLGLSGYVTAVIAVQLFGAQQPAPTDPGDALASLQREVHLLRQELDEFKRAGQARVRNPAAATLGHSTRVPR